MWLILIYTASSHLKILTNILVGFGFFFTKYELVVTGSGSSYLRLNQCYIFYKVLWVLIKFNNKKFSIGCAKLQDIAFAN